MSTDPAISIEDLSFSYDGHPVLEGVNISIETGDFASIVGPNGGGKTTLLKLMVGLLQPAAGRVRIFGVSPEQARPHIGYMPQHTRLDPLFPASVMDVVLMGRLGRGWRFGPYSRVDKRIASRALEEVKAYHLRDNAFSAVSGGQQQRVLIARALACEPDLLLLDEPTSNLDVVMEEDFYDLLRRLNERLTVVLVSHDLGFVSGLVKTVVCVKRKVFIHPTVEITGEIINQMYGSPMRMVRHNHSAPKDVCQ